MRGSGVVVARDGLSVLIGGPGELVLGDALRISISWVARGLVEKVRRCVVW